MGGVTVQFVSVDFLPDGVPLFRVGTPSDVIFLLSSTASPAEIASAMNEVMRLITVERVEPYWQFSVPA